MVIPDTVTTIENNAFSGVQGSTENFVRYIDTYLVGVTDTT